MTAETDVIARTLSCLQPSTSHALRLLCAVAMACAAGCKRGPDIPSHPPRTPTAGRAELPATPPLDPATVAASHADGAWTVRGLLRADRKKLTGQQTVRGYVAALETCPPEAKACKPAPHLYLTDSADGTGQRLLVGGERDLQARGWKTGQQITAQGELGTASADGVYFAPGGMLLLTPLAPAAVDPTAGTAARPDIDAR